MASIYEIEDRQVIPNWRDFHRTLLLGELKSSESRTKSISFNIDRSVIDWKLEKNIGTAADLLNASFISNIRDNAEIKEAAQFVQHNSSNASLSLLQLAKDLSQANKEIENSNKVLLEVDLKDVHEFHQFIDGRFLHRFINRTRSEARDQLYNPILWVELARLYSINGQQKKGERAMDIALQLAPNNRFVLRSATRLFIHGKQMDRALYHLRKSPALMTDPWLISAHIATSTKMGRFSPVVKKGKELLESKNHSPHSLTELASSLGTLELDAGSNKKAKQLFNTSMIAPNDNSLAQLEWAAKDKIMLNVDLNNYSEVINPFEAYALDYFDKAMWSDAFNFCQKWFIDVPYSTAPVMLGSYIAGTLMKNKEIAIRLCEAGLVANPHDPILLNNIVYDISTSEQPQRAEKYINDLLSIDYNSLVNESKLTIQATLGLYCLRNNQHNRGKQLYEASIKNAEIIKNEYLRKLAIVNYTRELTRLNLPEKEMYIDLVRNIGTDPKHKDIEVIRNEVLDLYEQSVRPSN